MSNQAQSILALDLGNAFTKAALFDVVAGRRRFLARACAPTSLQTREPDVVDGVVAAIRSLQDIVGRPILGANGLTMPERPDGSGIDDCVMVTSVNATIKVLAVGATLAKAIDLAADVKRSACAVVAGTIGLAAEQGRTGSRIARVLETLHREGPNVLAISGDEVSRNAMVELAQCLAISGRSIIGGISIVVVGKEDDAVPLRQMLPEGSRLHVLNGPSGSERSLLLAERLSAIWQERWLLSVSGATELRRFGFGLPVPAQDGFSVALRFLAAYEKTDVWGVDVGASVSTASSVVDGQASTMVSADLGIGKGCAALLEAVTDVAQWRPAPAQSEGTPVVDDILHKLLHPLTVPETSDELAQQGALARAVGSRGIAALPTRSTQPARSSALLVGCGAPFTEIGGRGHAALLMLDVFQPVGLVALAIDRLRVLPMLGAIAQRHPEAGTELLVRDGVQRLGWCVGLGGALRSKEATAARSRESVAATITIGSGRDKLRRQVQYGKIDVLPAKPGSVVTVKPSGKLDAGAGIGRQAKCAISSNGRLVVDARRRPVDLSSVEEGARLDRLAEWRRALEG